MTEFYQEKRIRSHDNSGNWTSEIYCNDVGTVFHYSSLKKPWTWNGWHEGPISSKCNNHFNQNLPKLVWKTHFVGHFRRQLQGISPWSRMSSFQKKFYSRTEEYLNGRKLSFNFFQSGDAWNACTSIFTYRECEVKHQTILQNSSMYKNAPQNKKAAEYTESPSRKTSNSNNALSMKKFTTGHFNALNKIKNQQRTTFYCICVNPVFVWNLQKALCSLRLWFVGQFHLSKIAKSLFLHTIKNQFTVMRFDFVHPQKTLSKTFDNICMDERCNWFSETQIDIPQMKPVHNLGLPDPAFYLPCKIGIVLSADVGENIL